MRSSTGKNWFCDFLSGLLPHSVEKSQPNFYQLKISWEVNFSQILMGIAWKMVLPRPWPFETSQGRGRLIFWATTSKFGEKTHLLMIFKWYEIMFLIPPLVLDLRKSGWAAPYISIMGKMHFERLIYCVKMWSCNPDDLTPLLLLRITFFSCMILSTLTMARISPQFWWMMERFSLQFQASWRKETSKVWWNSNLQSKALYLKRNV